MSYRHILFEVDQSGVALITVNRPEKLNALSADVITELQTAFERVANEAAVRAAIVAEASRLLDDRTRTHP